MKKIGIIYGGAKSRGGIYTYLLNLFEGFSDNKKIELEMISIGRWPLCEEFKKRNYSYTILKRNPLLLFKAASTKEYDLIITMGMVSDFFGRFWSIFSGIPVITIVHSDWQNDYPGLLKKIIYFFSNRIFRFKTKRYITVSKYLKARLIEEGVPKEKIEVIYNGVKLDFKDLKLKKGKIIGSIGRLHPVKNYINLIKAAEKIEKKYNYKFKIWGDGEQKEELQKIIGKGKFATLEGQINDVKSALSQIDVYIQPSFSEGFGLTVIEAMFAGLPVVVTPGGALKELVKDGKTGIVAAGFDEDDIFAAINCVVEDSTKKAELARAGQKYAKANFSTEKWLERMEKVFLYDSLK